MRARRPPIAGVGAAAPYRLVAALLVASIVAFLLTSLALVGAADDLARGAFAAPAVLLTVHLLVLGFLPLGVAGAVFHVLPLLLRGIPRVTSGWAVLVCFSTGPLLAVGIARHHGALTWAATAVFAVGFALLLAETARLIVTAPPGKVIVVSRFGVSAAALHGALSFVLGPLLFQLRWRPFVGIPHERVIAIHLHLAVIGCVTLLIIAVGRTLVPMLAVAPVAPRRKWPTVEIAITIGLWLSISGFAFGQRWPIVLGTLAIVAAVGRFFALAVRAAATRRVPSLEGPLLHALAGLGFLVQAGALTILMLGHPLDSRTLAAYVVSLVVGWASGVTLGHVGKLLAISAWTSWPPGPRPKQAAFYDRFAWTAEVIVFSFGCELLVVGTLVEGVAVARAGAVLLVLSSVLALRGAHSTIALRSSPGVGR